MSSFLLFYPEHIITYWWRKWAYNVLNTLEWPSMDLALVFLLLNLNKYFPAGNNHILSSYFKALLIPCWYLLSSNLRATTYCKSCNAKKWSFPWKSYSLHAIRSAGLWVWSHLLKKSLMENFIFLCCAKSYNIQAYESHLLYLL